MRLVENLYEGNDPQKTILRSIEWIVAVCTLVGGIYIFTPLYAVSKASNGASLFASSLGHPLSIFLWGSLLLVGAILVIFGKLTKRPQVKSVGWFSIFLARFFQILTTILVQGFLPLSWIYPFTVMLIVMVLWLRARLEVYQNAAP